MKKLLPFFLFSVVICVAFIIAPNIGVTWDEPDNIYASGIYIHFFQHQLNPTTFLNPNDSTMSYYGGKIFTQNASLERYPPFPLYIGSIIALLRERLFQVDSPLEIFISYHIATGFFLAILVVSVYVFARRMGLSLASSLVAALSVWLHPTIFGYGHSNIKDTAQVALFVLSLYFLVSSTILKKRFYLVLGAIIWGFAMATKFNAIYVPIIWWTWAFFFQKKLSFHFSAVRTHCIHLISQGLLLVVIGLSTTLFVWPYLWFDTITRVRNVVAYFTTVGTGYAIFWNGTKYLVGIGMPLPWYPLGYLFIATPVILLFLSVIGVLFILFSLKAEKKIIRLSFGGLLLLWFFIPLVRTISPKSAFYDGIRHFMEIIPVLGLLTGIGMEAILRWLKHRIEFIRSLPSQFLYLVPFLYVVVLFFIATIYFPYGTGYINESVSHPNEQFDRDFFGLSIKEGVDYLHTKYKNLQLYVPVAGHLSWYYLQLGDVYVYQAPLADSVILLNKGSHVVHSEIDNYLQNAFRLEYTMRRGNAVFGWVYRRKE